MTAKCNHYCSLIMSMYLRIQLQLPKGLTRFLWWRNASCFGFPRKQTVKCVSLSRVAVLKCFKHTSDDNASKMPGDFEVLRSFAKDLLFRM